jgi:hypothetical protein
MVGPLRCQLHTHSPYDEVYEGSFTKISTEQVGLEKVPCTCILEVLGSNFGWDTALPQ